jgi:hypothetical protein
MPSKAELQAQITLLQAQLAQLNSIPEDTFPFGTIAIISYGPGGVGKYYRVKVEEETWKNLVNSDEKSLSEWIVEAIDSNIGYFEVYVAVAEEVPFYPMM